MSNHEKIKSMTLEEMTALLKKQNGSNATKREKAYCKWKCEEGISGWLKEEYQ